jgi:hypothetical protein
MIERLWGGHIKKILNPLIETPGRNSLSRSSVSGSQVDIATAEDPLQLDVAVVSALGPRRA